MSKKDKFFEKLDSYVKESLKNEKSMHDYKHSKRVLKHALVIAKNYPEIDKEVLVAACLLHDIAFKDGFVKYHNKLGVEQARVILKNLNFPPEKINNVCNAILHHCGNIYKDNNEEKLTLEDKILRDADNIDAFGNIGVKRMLSFCRDNNIPYFKSKEDWLDDSVYGGIKAVISWEKTLFTKEAKEMAKPRIKIMENYLKKMEKEVLK